MMTDRQTSEPDVEPCEWREDDDGVWHTGCGTSFFFDTDGPKENKFHFCYHCGKRLAPKPWVREP